MRLQIQFTDDLPEDPLIIHPMIKIHVLDMTTGRYLTKANKTIASSKPFKAASNISFINRLLILPFTSSFANPSL